MIFEDIEGFAAVLPATACVIGLDLGTKTIGVALSDVMQSVASPTETVKRSKFTAVARPGDELDIAVRWENIDGGYELRGTVTAAGEKTCTAVLVVG